MLVIAIIQTILAGIFGWFIGELFAKSEDGVIKDFKTWKVIVLELIFIAVLYTADTIGETRIKNKVYNTKEYAIETIDTTFDTDSTEVTTFKIVRK